MASVTGTVEQSYNVVPTIKWAPINQSADGGDCERHSGYKTFVVSRNHPTTPSSLTYDTAPSNQLLHLKVDTPSDPFTTFYPRRTKTDEDDVAEILLDFQRRPTVFGIITENFSVKHLSRPTTRRHSGLPGQGQFIVTDKSERPLTLRAVTAETLHISTPLSPKMSPRTMKNLAKRLEANDDKPSTSENKPKAKPATKDDKKLSKLEQGNLLYEMGVRCQHEGSEPCDLTAMTKGVVMRGPFRKVVSDYFGRNQKCTREIPDTFWIMTCRKHYQRSIYRNTRARHVVRSKLIKILAEVKLIDELCKHETVWTIELKQPSSPASKAETKTNKAAKTKSGAKTETKAKKPKAEPDAKQVEMLADVVRNLHASELIGQGKSTAQVVGALNLIGSAFTVGLTEMLSNIQFLPSGMPDSKQAPKKPEHPIRWYIREAEKHFDWLETPEEAEEDEDVNMEDEVEDAAAEAHVSEEDVESEDSE